MLPAACLIVSTSASMVMLDEQHRYSLPVASGLPPGPPVLLCDGESSGTNAALMKPLICPGHEVVMSHCAHFISFICSPPVFLFDYRLPLPLRLGYWLHCNFGGSRDDLHCSEQLRLHLSYNSSCW